MKKKTRGRDINTASEAVATSACKEIKVATSFISRDIMSKREAVATTPSCRDINCEDLRSRQQKQGKEVPTSVSCHDIHCKESKVATSSSCRDNSYKGRKVETSFRGRDIHCTDQKVVTSYSSRDIKYKELRSRHHSAVATPEFRKAGSNIIKLSRHQL